jgi:sulfate adenylyltransferase subunit 1
VDILKFITAGSVDDGKSTLIGRLLYDSKNILSDQLEAIEKSSKGRNNGDIDLALITDGLRSEREQGITIDVAYRYFATPVRKFIIADAPGHIQYTRNMITGASNVDLAIVLIDARQGVVEQTKRHSMIASLLKIQHIVVAINKMDLVEYDENTFNNIVNDYTLLAQKLGFKNATFFPISALVGDNIVNKSDNMPWFTGEPLLSFLEKVNVVNDINHTDARFQVQYVIRPQTAELHDYRGYAGKITSGVYSKGDSVKIMPQGIESIIEKIEVAGVQTETAFAPQNVTFLLQNDIDISRGDYILKSNTSIGASNEHSVIICWLDNKPLIQTNKYLLQHNHKVVKVSIKELLYKIDVNSFDKINQFDDVKLNEIVYANLKTASPLVTDAYNDLKTNGAAILIDETSNSTVAAVLFQ